MRFSYYLAVAVVAILHGSGHALSMIKDSSQAMIENSDSPDDVVHSLDTNQSDGGRFLRKCNVVDEVDEERSFKKVTSFLKKQLPWTKAGKEAKRAKKLKNQQYIIKLFQQRQRAGAN